MTARDTSLEAFKSLDLQGQETALMRLVHIHFPYSRFTRKELSAKTGWTINRVCGRVFSLIEKGYLTEYPQIRDGGHLLSVSQPTAKTAPGPAPEKPAGTGREVVSEKLVTTWDRQGKPFQYVSVIVRDR